MRVLVLHNPTAGEGDHARDDLIHALERGAHRVRYHSTKELRWKEQLDAAADVIVVAGGDGTVRRVGIAIATWPSRPSAPLVVVPLGTANNIARSLGADWTLEALSGDLEHGALTRLAVGRAVGPWGEGRFVESAGVGVFPAMLHLSREAEAERRHAKEGATEAIAGGAERLRRALEAATARRLSVDADGQDLSGEYLMVEAMNIRSIGPCAHLAPDADHAEDILDLVLIGERERPRLERYFEWLGDCAGVESPIPTRPARAVTLEWPMGQGHLDDTLWPKDLTRDVPGTRVALTLDTSVPVLIPPPREDR